MRANTMTAPDAPGERGLCLHLGRSYRLGGLLVAGHVGGGLLLVPLTLPPWARAVAWLALAGSLAYYLLRDGLRRLPRSVVELVLLRERAGPLRCELRLRNGARCAGRVLGTTLAVPALVILRMRPQGATFPRSVTVPHDSLRPADLRALRVMLRWGGGPP